MRAVHSDEVRVPALRLEGFEGEWSETTLGQVSYRSAEKNSDLTYSETFTNSAQNGVVSQLDYFDNQVSNAANVGGYYVVKPGDFVYNPRLSVTAPVGPLNRNDLSRTGIVSPLYTVFTLTGLDSDFTKWLFKGQTWHRYMQTAGDSGVRGDRLSISNADFFDMPLKAPSREEQRLIGDYLNRVETLVDSTALRLTSLTSFKKTMLVKMFPQGTASMPEVRFEGFEGDWGNGTLGDIGRTYTGLSGKTKEDFGHGDGRFVTYMNVFSNPVLDPSKVEPTPVDSRQNTIRNGDVLFTTSSEVPDEAGMSCVVDGVDGDVYLNSFCFGFRPNQSIERDYWAYMLRSRSVRNQFEMLAQGISRFNISPTRAMAVEVPLPSLPEQQAIGSYFRNLDALIEAEQKKLDTLRNLKSALLTQMFV